MYVYCALELAQHCFSHELGTLAAFANACVQAGCSSVRIGKSETHGTSADLCPFHIDNQGRRQPADPVAPHAILQLAAGCTLHLVLNLACHEVIVQGISQVRGGLNGEVQNPSRLWSAQGFSTGTVTTHKVGLNAVLKHCLQDSLQATTALNQPVKPKCMWEQAMGAVRVQYFSFDNTGSLKQHF